MRGATTQNTGLIHDCDYNGKDWHNDDDCMYIEFVSAKKDVFERDDKGQFVNEKEEFVEDDQVDDEGKRYNVKWRKKK